MGKKRSWVWEYAKRKGDKAYCQLCDEDENNEYSCVGGTTGSIIRHLKIIHKVYQPETSTSKRLSSSNNLEEIDTLQDTDSLTNSQSSSSSSNNSFTQPSQHNIIPRKRRRFLTHDNDTDRKCSPERTETIHKALAKLISMNQLPLSFCSSPGFYQFMAVVEPNYKIIKEEALKKRLHFFKSSIEEKIRSDLKAVQSVVCTSDCWSSLAQNSYITITAHALNNDWSPMSFTLTTQEMEERHTALNIADKLENVFSNWEIKDKVTTVITDNAKNVVNAVQLVSNTTNDNISDVTCAAHSLQLSINKALREDSISEILDQSSKLVGHFKHSNLAKQSLLNKQKQLGMPETSLLQSCKTRWNSIFLMLEHIFKNRCLISAVMADRSVTSTHIAQKFEISEHQWLKIEALVFLLKPFQVITSFLCGEKHSPTSMVRPLLKKLLDNHLKPQDNDDQSITYFKQTIIFDIKERFNLEWDSKSRVSVRQIASFLDPRYKNLDHEPLFERENIRSSVINLLNNIETDAHNVNTRCEPSLQQSALEFLYGDDVTEVNNLTTEFQNYLAEPQLKFHLNPFDWWKSRENKFPRIGILAKKYLSIPATSVSSERCFSTAGNVVNSKRTSLLTKNVNLLVFLYQNRNLIP
ncbi:hypothetical protein QTP88_009560 [Uroleucon formosanum]